MLIDFFFRLKDAKVPVSIKEYLMLMEGLRQEVINPTLDDLYLLAKLTLVKDERYFDRFDRVFGEFFKGLESLGDLFKDIPKEWLEKRREKAGRQCRPVAGADRGGAAAPRALGLGQRP